MRALDVDKGMVLTLRQSDFAVVDGRDVHIIPAHDWLLSAQAH